MLPIKLFKSAIALVREFTTCNLIYGWHATPMPVDIVKVFFILLPIACG
jgi:hypothetical protein